jgi:hypothetical protein
VNRKDFKIVFIKRLNLDTKLNKSKYFEWNGIFKFIPNTYTLISVGYVVDVSYSNPIKHKIPADWMMEYPISKIVPFNNKQVKRV